MASNNRNDPIRTCARDLLEKHEETKLKVFTTTSYSLPKSTASLAKQFPIKPVKDLLTNIEEYHKETWELLKKEIKVVDQAAY